jgi:hypothetical protein
MFGYFTGLFSAKGIAKKGCRICVTKTPGTSKIVLGSGAANSRIFSVGVNEKLNLTFAPPSIG